MGEDPELHLPIQGRGRGPGGVAQEAAGNTGPGSRDQIW